ncbi:MAG TPA: cytochrome c oxidase subunit 3 [Terrimicrobiaceae bacterium]|nr:cytochrome c oxidase subunit 3 [Terrimicrobiaceae bacterium]
MTSEKMQAGEPADFINDPSGTEAPWRLPSQRKTGIICLIITESALFSIFVVAYLFYMGKSLVPPYPSQVLEFPLWGSIALFSSSATVIVAEKMLHKMHRPGFLIWWGLTILLGAYFVYFTGAEWAHLIFDKQLTLSKNVFGTTFYALVGLHLSHVIVGLILLSIVWALAARGKIPKDHTEHVEMISWYWHFVDAIWVVVLTVVYIISVKY